jgi:hypothetical protein
MLMLTGKAGIDGEGESNVYGGGDGADITWVGVDAEWGEHRPVALIQG